MNRGTRSVKPNLKLIRSSECSDSVERQPTSRLIPIASVDEESDYLRKSGVSAALIKDINERTKATKFGRRHNAGIVVAAHFAFELIKRSLGIEPSTQHTGGWVELSFEESNDNTAVL